MKKNTTIMSSVAARCIAPVLTYPAANSRTRMQAGKRCMGGNASPMSAPRRKSLRVMQAGERGSVLRCSP